MQKMIFTLARWATIWALLAIAGVVALSFLDQRASVIRSLAMIWTIAAMCIAAVWVQEATEKKGE